MFTHISQPAHSALSIHFLSIKKNLKRCRCFSKSLTFEKNLDYCILDRQAQKGMRTGFVQRTLNHGEIVDMGKMTSQARWVWGGGRNSSKMAIFNGKTTFKSTNLNYNRICNIYRRYIRIVSYNNALSGGTSNIRSNKPTIFIKRIILYIFMTHDDVLGSYHLLGLGLWTYWGGLPHLPLSKSSLNFSRKLLEYNFYYLYTIHIQYFEAGYTQWYDDKCMNACKDKKYYLVFTSQINLSELWLILNCLTLLV